MKILLVIDSLGAGGAQRQICFLANGLTGLGHEVHIAYYQENNFFKTLLESSSIQLFYIQKIGKIGFNVMRSLTALYRKEKYTIVIAYLNIPCFYAVAAKRLSGSNSLIITSQRSSTNFSKRTLRLFLNKITNRFADFVLTNSFHEKENWIKHFPSIRDKIKCIYNGLDLNSFHPGNREKKLNYRILVVGKVRPLKNGLTILKAMKILKDRGKLCFSLTWLGDKVSSNQSYLEYYEDMVDKIEDYDLKHHWFWENSSSNVQNYYWSHDLLLHSSLLEGMPNVVCEAMACGMPVIISEGFDHARLVTHEVNGFVFNPHNPSELADVLQRFYSFDLPGIAIMGQSSRVRAIKLFDQERILNRHIRLFQKLTNVRKS